MSVLAILFISLCMILSNFSDNTEAKTFLFKETTIDDIQIACKQNRLTSRQLVELHGIPVLVKDNIATKDKLNTTAGSLALVRSIVPQDAGVVKKLRKAGAIILGKATMTE
ncbi:hypothetical protein HAX54_039803 [Datura stramonium]|uniref:Amidase domain-containing protein n=1 Tax=Datura stramonium TaxID=4076 RepID=A0ABS8SJG7_DATST|nr:hypothetical protein [Datura stramonium]